MHHFFLRHLIFVQGCAFAPAVSAFTPNEEAPVQIEAPADLPAVVYPTADNFVEDADVEMCGAHIDATVDIRVRAGESLHHFARWSNSTVEEIALLNEIDVRTPLTPGQALLLPIEEEDLDQLETDRVADGEAKLARYISDRGGLAGISAHQVKTGETGWGIAKNEASVPMWVLAGFNTTVDMDSIRAGDTIYLPILGESLGKRFDAQAEAAVTESVAGR